MIGVRYIKRYCYGTHPLLNPTRIIPKGPAIEWTAPHVRARFVDAAL
jgi:glutathionyl-hydroquinone reductase